MLESVIRWIYVHNRLKSLYSLFFALRVSVNQMIHIALFFLSYRPDVVKIILCTFQSLPLKALSWLLPVRISPLCRTVFFFFLEADFHDWRIFHQWPFPTTGFLRNYRVLQGGAKT